MLVVVARLQRVNECGFEAATLLPILRCVGYEIKIAASVTRCFECVSGAAQVTLPEVVALPDSQGLLVTICLDIDARSRAKSFARLYKTGKTLERKSERH